MGRAVTFVFLEEGAVAIATYRQQSEFDALGQAAGPDLSRLEGYDIDVTDEGLDLEKIIGQIEKEILIKAIHRASGVKKRAAKLLGITFRSMRYRVEKYGLSGPGDEELVDD